MARTHTSEPAPEGVHRGKRYSRASCRLQITMAGTRAREPPEGVHRGKPYTRGPYRLQMTMAGTHTQESRRPKASIVASATAEPPIDCKSQWQGHAKDSRRPKASIAASARAEPPIERKSQWQRHTQDSRRPKASIGRDTLRTAAAPRRQSRQALQQSLL